MKKILVIVAAFVAMSITSCNNGSAVMGSSNADNVDTAVVDTVDSVAVDSVCNL